jgi:alkaline phosphatase D
LWRNKLTFLQFSASDRDITDLDYNTEYVGQLAIQLNTTRSLTGPVQEAWLLDGLSKSKAKGTAWRLLLNQVIMGSINETATDATGAGDYVIDYDACAFSSSGSRLNA